ncbi:MAG: TIR domain-containing protein [Oscillospiraceae bacterium]|nr:TIR domain-containing protein [Oscillospiraceae bacterium]
MNTNQPANNNEKFRFDVFISYRHSDLDSAAAAYLHKMLENYKIPKEIQEKIGKQRINRVFRDEEELGASSDLFTEIENSIKDSEYLVVILSPRYKESKWCIKEIESFLKHRSRDNILAVIIEGEPYDVFPDILLEEGEPLALDIRADSKKHMLKLLKERLPRLVAPVLGCTYDELYQRHRVYRMRRMAMLCGVVAAVSLLFGAVTIRQNIEINRNFTAKQENQSRYLAQTASRLMETGDRETALLVALEALPKSSTDTSRPYVAEARVALQNALYTYQMDYYYNLHPLKIMEQNSDCGVVSDYNKDENVLLTSDDTGSLYVWDADTAERLYLMDRYSAEDAYLAGNHRLVFKTADGVACVDYTTGEMLWTWLYPRCEVCYTGSFAWAYSKDTDTVICTNKTMSKDSFVKWEEVPPVTEILITDSHRMHIIDAATGKRDVWTQQDYFDKMPKTGYQQYVLKDIAISPDGSLVAFQIYEPDYDNYESVAQMHLFVYPAKGGDAVYTASFEAYQGIEGLYWLDNSRLLCGYTDDVGILSLGIVETPHRWHIDCHDVAKGEKVYSISEKSMSLSYAFKFDSFTCYDKQNNPVNRVSVINGNTAIVFDNATGQLYSRIEDRSQICMAQPLPNGRTLLVMTMDGYVFVTNPINDQVYNPVLSSYQYYIDIGIVEKAERYNDKTYIFNGSSVYWYQDYIDFNYTPLGTGPANVGFSDNGQYMFFVSHDDKITMYDVNTKETVSTGDTQHRTGYLHGEKILQDRFLVYPAQGKAGFCVDDMQTGRNDYYAVTQPRYDSTELQLGMTDTSLTMLTAIDPLEMYGPAEGYIYNRELMQKNILWLADAGTGEKMLSFSGENIVDALGNRDNLKRFAIRAAFVSGGGNYLLVPCSAVYADGDGRDMPKTTDILIWDIEKGIWVDLPADIIPAEGAHWQQDGWIMPGSDIISIYSPDGSINIVDISAGKILHSLDFGVVGSTEVSFTPDGDHIIMQDSANRLKIYNWKEGRYTLEKAVGEIGALEFTFYDGGHTMSATLSVGAYISKVVQMYDMTEPGVYTLQNSISSCAGCNGVTTVISDNEYSRFYPYYSFDQLIEMAREILGDRQLTAAERQTYFID